MRRKLSRSLGVGPDARSWVLGAGGWVLGATVAMAQIPSPVTPDSSVAALERAVALDSMSATAWAALSVAYSSMYREYTDRTFERLEQAGLAAQRAVDLAPGIAATHEAMGYYHYWGTRELGAARQEFTVALTMNPRNAAIRGVLADVLRRVGDWDSSIAGWGRAMALARGNAGDVEERGITFTWMRRHEEAERDLERSLALAPNRAVPAAYLALLVLSRDGSLRRAPASIGSLPEHPETFAHLTLREPGVMLPLWRMVVPLQSSILVSAPPEDRRARAGHFLAMGQVLALRGRDKDAQVVYDSVRAIMTELVEQYPADDGFHEILALAHAGLGMCEEALRLAQRAVDLIPVAADGMAGTERIRGLAEVEARCGRLDHAAVHLDYLLSRPSTVTRMLLRADPAYLPLRGLPRFERILAGQ